MVWGSLLRILGVGFRRFRVQSLSFWGFGWRGWEARASWAYALHTVWELRGLDATICDVLVGVVNYCPSRLRSCSRSPRYTHEIPIFM